MFKFNLKNRTMKNIYQKITEKTKKNHSHKFEIKGENFRTFIDSDKDFCLTHYGKDGENAWCVYNAKGLENKIYNLTK